MQILIKNIPDAIDEIYVLSKKSELKCYSNKIKLCSSQLAKVLPSFVKILTTRTDPAFKVSFLYILLYVYNYEFPLFWKMK